MAVFVPGLTLADAWPILKDKENNLQDDIVFSVFFENGCIVAILQPVYENVDGKRFTKSLCRARLTIVPEPDGI